MIVKRRYKVLYGLFKVKTIFTCYMVYSTSRGDFGRLGHGDYSDLLIPHPIRAFQGLRIKQIACGDSHCLAVTIEKEVLRENLSSSLGLGDRNDRFIPEKVTVDGNKVVMVACGWRHTISVSSSGGIYRHG
ncbi:hypothetical protein RIF29_08419 [Crotalaria pallida]|uniref:Uncharacterized protein n=1 Tax=Crotalaria pallida TaxID=3830 RepID=A0AAN9FXB7_CROPI